MINVHYYDAILYQKYVHLAGNPTKRHRAEMYINAKFVIGYTRAIIVGCSTYEIIGNTLYGGSVIVDEGDPISQFFRSVFDRIVTKLLLFHFTNHKI